MRVRGNKLAGTYKHVANTAKNIVTFPEGAVKRDRSEHKWHKKVRSMH